MTDDQDDPPAERPDDPSPSPPRAYNRVDDNIRRVYRDLEKEPVPDRFQQLIEQLRQQDNPS